MVLPAQAASHSASRTGRIRRGFASKKEAPGPDLISYGTIGRKVAVGGSGSRGVKEEAVGFLYKFLVTYLQQWDLSSKSKRNQQQSLWDPRLYQSNPEHYAILPILVDEKMSSARHGYQLFVRPAQEDGQKFFQADIVGTELSNVMKTTLVEFPNPFNPIGKRRVPQAEEAEARKISSENDGHVETRELDPPTQHFVVESDKGSGHGWAFQKEAWGETHYRRYFFTYWRHHGSAIFSNNTRFIFQTFESRNDTRWRKAIRKKAQVLAAWDNHSFMTSNGVTPGEMPGHY
ncbi:hypothetical protein T439DRAFT_173271 [Meredithblackwellia eburnea MCA 4105]